MKIPYISIPACARSRAGELFDCADEYVRRSSWKDLALIKLCLCAIGVMLGLCVPKEKRRPILIVTAVVFLATYIPLMVKFVRIICERLRRSE